MGLMMPAASKEISSHQLMSEIIQRAASAILEALKREHKGNQNLIIRDIMALHSNATYEDLPEYVKKAVQETTAAMFGYINKHGFVLIPRK
jgi:hypothetical protein